MAPADTPTKLPPEQLPPTAGSITSRLTDATGISKLTSSKLFKDFVLDILLAVPSGFLAINVGGIQAALVMPAAVAFVIGDAVVKAGYRIGVRWAQTSS